jgi:hypothetical protein
MKKILSLMLASALILTGVFFAFRSDAKAFDPNLLISDSIFDSSMSMSVGQIDGFLNGFPNSCISLNSGFDARVPSGYTPSGGFTYGGFGSAGQVIATAAQVYGLNPQVLLVTLQKEQSLVAGGASYCNNGDEHKYASAMGYGCPDSGGYNSWSGVSLYRRYGVEHTSTGRTCVNSAAKAGFSQQVIRAAWLLKFGQQRSMGNTGWAVISGSWDNSDDPASSYGGPMTRGTFKRCGSCASTFYDGYTSIDSTSTFMGSGATAALYWYTPHFHGNQNFVSLFESWFGSTVGDLARTVNDATVYLLSGDNKYPISDQSVLNDFSVLGPIRYVSDASLAAKTTGPTLGHMAGQGGGTLYFVNAGIKLAFTSCASVADYGYSCAQVPYLTDVQISRLSSGPNITQRYDTTSGKQFYISGGQRREIFDSTAASQAGITAPANSLLEDGLSYLPYGAPVMRNEVVAIDRNTREQFYYDGSTYLGLAGDLAVTPAFANLPHSNLDDPSVPANLRDNSFKGLVKNSAGTQFYVLLQSGKAQLSNSSLWPTASFRIFNDTFIGNAQTDNSGNINSRLIKSNTDGTVYYLNGGAKRPIPSWSDLTGLHVQPQTINTVPATTVNIIPAGSLAYAPGSLIKTTNSSTVYVVGDIATLYPITSFIFPAELGLAMNLRTAPDINSYTTAGNLQNKTSCNSNNYIGTKGVIYLVPGSMMTAYGFNQSDFVAAPSLCANLNIGSQNLTDFIRSPDGTIYHIESGQKRAFTNYQAYLNNGGSSSNTREVSDYFASTIPSGSSITQ